MYGVVYCYFEWRKKDFEFEVIIYYEVFEGKLFEDFDEFEEEEE